LSSPIFAQLPPSVRGHLFKAAYKILICVQLTLSGTNTEVRTEVLQLPFRVLPAPVMYHSLRTLDGPDASSLTTMAEDSGLRDQLSLESNPFWSDDHSTAPTTGSPIDWPGFMMDQLILNTDSPPARTSTSVRQRHRYPSESVVNAGQLRSALSLATTSRPSATFSPTHRAPPFDPFGSSDRSDLGSEQSTLGFSRPSSATQPGMLFICIFVTRKHILPSVTC
uniref:ATG13 domain-containing protein n=1 Tax=Echinostoma caproni TaxID=27848 RepID=A0A183A3H0_9TREM